MIKYVATVFFMGIGNEIININAANYDAAFKLLFNYYLDKGDRLGHWLDDNGENAGDFNDIDGQYEDEHGWSWHIEEAAKIKTIGEVNIRKEIFCGWTTADAMSKYPTLTEAQAYEIMSFVDKHKDYDQGVTWDSIKYAMETLYPNLINKQHQ